MTLNLERSTYKALKKGNAPAYPWKEEWGRAESVFSRRPSLPSPWWRSRGEYLPANSKAKKSTPEVKRVRKNPADDVQDIVPTRSNRVCALCWAFERDGRAKRQGQLAHIDRDRSNSALENLAWLCLSCHDTYDSTPQQSKKLRPAELLAHKATVEMLVAESRLPTHQSAGGALLTVDLEAATIHSALASNCLVLRLHCLFANEGERATGLKRITIAQGGQSAGGMSMLRRRHNGRPLTDHSFYLSGDEVEHFAMHQDQVLEPGTARQWLVDLRLRLQPSCLREQGQFVVVEGPPVTVSFQPVLGAPVSFQLSQFILGTPMVL